MKWFTKLSYTNKKNIFKTTESQWSLREHALKGRRHDEFFILVSSIHKGLKKRKLT